jgi:hypothetical protein
LLTASWRSVTGSSRADGIEHEGVRVPHHDRAAEAGEQVEAGPGLRPALRDVAEADGLLETLGRELREHGPQRDGVAMGVREDRRSQVREILRLKDGRP